MDLGYGIKIDEFKGGKSKKGAVFLKGLVVWMVILYDYMHEFDFC